MRLFVCLRDECEDFIPKEPQDSYGFADAGSDTVYVLVDNIMRTAFSFFILQMKRTDIPLACFYDICLYCSHHDDDTGECRFKVGTNCIINIYCSAINKVALHELLHLCGCSEQDLRRDTEILRKFYKERLCPKFKRRPKIVIDDLSETHLNVAFLFSTKNSGYYRQGVVNAHAQYPLITLTTK
jgi:hypothetical protein